MSDRTKQKKTLAQQIADREIAARTPPTIDLNERCELLKSLVAELEAEQASGPTATLIFIMKQIEEVAHLPERCDVVRTIHVTEIASVTHTIPSDLLEGSPAEAPRDVHAAMDSLVTSSAEFLAVWRRLADDGACDAAGSSEQRRVMDEWYAAGKPEIEPFIRDRANVTPWSKS